MCCCLLPYGLCCFTGWKSSQSRSHRTEEEKEGGTWAKGGEKVFSCCALPPLRACVCVCVCGVCWLTPSIRPSSCKGKGEEKNARHLTEYRAIVRARERPVVDRPNSRSDHQTLNSSFIIRTHTQRLRVINLSLCLTTHSNLNTTLLFVWLLHRNIQ